MEPTIKIPLEPVESSNLQAVGYDPKRQILAVQFKNSDIFHYAGVSLDVAQALYTAESRGRFYSQNIRGKFTGAKMTGECPKCGDRGWGGDVCRDCGCASYVVAEMPARHADDGSSSGRQRRAMCGAWGTAREFAPHVDQVTCAACKAVLAEREDMEVPF